MINSTISEQHKSSGLFVFYSYQFLKENNNLIVQPKKQISNFFNRYEFLCQQKRANIPGLKGGNRYVR